ncbi:MAG: zeta toxin family protein [Zoogloeaceae bacterium]|jgi:hypothetical protein|nr:zeta toxin family protein [Zoogloeaceae bacterium]
MTTGEATKYLLCEEENQRVFEESIIPHIFGKTITPSQAHQTWQPVTIIFGGQPGAGKSASVEAAQREILDKESLRSSRLPATKAP